MWNSKQRTDRNKKECDGDSMTESESVIFEGENSNDNDNGNDECIVFLLDPEKGGVVGPNPKSQFAPMGGASPAETNLSEVYTMGTTAVAANASKTKDASYFLRRRRSVVRRRFLVVVATMILGASVWIVNSNYKDQQQQQQQQSPDDTSDNHANLEMEALDPQSLIAPFRLGPSGHGTGHVSEEIEATIAESKPRKGNGSTMDRFSHIEYASALEYESEKIRKRNAVPKPDLLP